MNEKDINVGRATICWCLFHKTWRLPDGSTTRDKLKAKNMAKRMDRIMSGRDKNQGAV